MARGGRKDHPIDRAQGPVAEFVDDLRRLRGTLTLEEVGRRMRYHPSTLSRRLSPKELPPRDFVEAYVRACGADPEPWIRRREELAGPPEAPDAGATDGGVTDGGVTDAGVTDDGQVREAAAPRWRRPRVLVPAAVAAAVAVAAPLLVHLLLADSPPSAEGTRATATLLAAPASSPPAVEPGHGFPVRIDRMAFRIFSSWWTQTAEGDVEFWSHQTCPPGTTAYWVALRPDREPARFACDSWQHHLWADVQPGTYHLEIWKEYDGQAIKGSGALRSSVPIVVHPKATPTPTAGLSARTSSPARP
ncbi:helix-turn-helix domain-containing protein [Nonomuraea pusilla]|uniref:Helix-turn-helix domain-containing protein n=1 Tax=Nonomuraea pusilla TaxID=46177 RepID=A0A1H8EW40_9ACTN|nr:helix-turn-helix transcriptional regulator [Nonomuraea pusilla]SEN23354.1 Helix-turn-helix domain-containing protein [Nonomuraea pusilla]